MSMMICHPVLSQGMILTAIIVFVWGCLFEYHHFYNDYAYLGLWALNGRYRGPYDTVNRIVRLLRSDSFI